MPRLALLCSIAVLLLTAALPAPSNALTWPDDMSLAEMAAEARLVVRGAVQDTRVHTVDIGGETPMLFTSIDIYVDRGFAGATEREVVTVRQIGGEMSNGYAVDIAGAPFYSPGEEVVLFANDADYPAFASMRADQGTWRTAWWNGRQLVLRSDWVPVLLETSAPGEVPVPARCMVDETAKNVCRRWVDADGEEVSGPVDPAVEPLLMTVQDFDAVIDELLPPRSPWPPQTYTDDADYAAALVAFFADLHRQRAPQEADPTGAQ